MTSVRAMTEHSSNGQIGQPAACMIDNKWSLAAPDALFERRDYGPKAGRIERLDARGFASGRCSEAALLELFTPAVDNFVGNRGRVLCKR